MTKEQKQTAPTALTEEQYREAAARIFEAIADAIDRHSPGMTYGQISDALAASAATVLQSLAKRAHVSFSFVAENFIRTIRLVVPPKESNNNPQNSPS